MTLLPSPIPHPLDYSPWELPGWVHEALDWVVGVEWPEGDERAVWALADQWYGVAEALAGPRADAVFAAGEVRGGYGGVGAVVAAFDAAWRRVAEGDEAPLPVLLAVSGDLGRLVEECGCDIEGAKLEVWIELGILVVELLSLAVAAVLTAGAASPAAGAAITASRFVVQQIFKKLIAQLARKSLKQGLKEAGERAAKQVAEGGVRGLARKAVRGGLAEAAEEAGVTLATQAYQNSTGRRHGLDLTDAGMSALGGLAGGAVAPLAGLGRHATGRAARVGEHFGREMTGEVIADQAASLATGQGLVSLDDAARAAASGATGSATGQTDVALRQRLDGRMAALGGASFAPSELGNPPDPSRSGGALSTGADISVTSHDGGTAGRQPTGEQSRLPQDGAAAPVPTATTPTAAAPTATTPTAAAPGQTSGVVLPTEHLAETVPVLSGVAVDAAVDSRSPVTHPGPGASEAPAHPTLSSAATADVLPTGIRSAEAGLAPVAGAVGSTLADPHAGAGSSVTSDPRPASLSTIGSSANTTAAPLPTPQHETGDPTRTPRWNRSAPGHIPFPPGVVSPAAPGPNPPPVPPPPRPPAAPESADASEPLPRSPEWYAAKWAADREAFARRRYQAYFQQQRTWYEEKRRRGLAAELRDGAERHYEQARWLIRQAYGLHDAGRTDVAARFIRGGREKERQYHRQRGLAEAVLAGTVAPAVVDVGNRDDFERINTDDPSLVVGAVETAGPSALTGDDDPPPIDRSRRYGQWGGLRPPLALHQSDLEGAMPRGADGQVLRTADPRTGGWFKLANDGGPRADPTRGINCLDCTLSLYETWMHGRPRVSAPRTFDAYSLGDVNRPIGGEIDGPGRVEDATGGRFQQFADAAQETVPHDAWKAVNRGFGSLEGHLRVGGHGSYAFLITTYEGGGSHAWVAVNQSGSVLYLDPQNGAVSDMPLYAHSGLPAPHNVVGMDALVLGPDGRPMPLPGAGPGAFSQRDAVAEEQPPSVERSREQQPGPDDPSDDDLYVTGCTCSKAQGPVDPGPLDRAGRPTGSPAGPPSADSSSSPRYQLSPHEAKVLEAVRGRAI
ncbi:toxin glutamine deamidase domain-containing protein [Micromonospora sp. RTGN7]|uniref:toxin glutamine deamidase domain-containing protein n=1 Tax=Micromonospora sp. RTGN7 TaxID=3016526 RepID=UPI0029FEDD02|nr:toxin glutamine deamidase domain-containing protein [Micromonospora sp. RTGN7]